MSSSYSDETVLSKLSSLNETQDAIVTVAQWLMFHRRTAKRSVELWLQRLKESAAHRKLNLIYLANEIVQQSKVKGKLEFVNVFKTVIAEGTEIAYRGNDSNIQGKIKRVIEVWRQRNIFEAEIQTEIERRVEGVDKGKSSGAKGGLKLGGMLGGSLGGGSSNMPLEFVPLMKTHKEVNDKASSCTIAVGAGNSEFAKQFDADNLPAPPVYASRLASLIKTLSTAQTAVKGAMEAREAHIRNLEKLLEQSKTALEKDRAAYEDLTKKRVETEKTKDDVEKMILEDVERSDREKDAGSADRSTTPDPMRSPEVEALTPPPQTHAEVDVPSSASEIHHQHSMAPAPPPEPAFHAEASELLATLTGVLPNGGAKRAPVDEKEVFEGIDPDLVKLLQNDGMQQAPKRQRVEAPAQDDDEYHP